jgi:acyl-CoA thioesterase YciA
MHAAGAAQRKGLASMTVQKPGAEQHHTAPHLPMPIGDPVIRTIAMPADTNPSGDIFGGWIMSQMDLAAGNAAARISQGRCATVAVEGMSFHNPVKVGDELTVWARMIKRGRSSMTFDVQAWRRPRDREAQTLVTRAHFTFVALDDNGRPRPLPDARDGETWV